MYINKLLNRKTLPRIGYYNMWVGASPGGKPNTHKKTKICFNFYKMVLLIPIIIFILVVLSSGLAKIELVHPFINELRRACGSDKISDAFKFLFMQDITEEERFLGRMEEENSLLMARIDKRDQMGEAFTSMRFNDIISYGTQCMVDAQLRDRRKVDVIAQLMSLTREGIEQKKSHVEKMKHEN